jgi:hypothetical protein
MSRKTLEIFGFLFNHLKAGGNCMYQAFKQSVMQYFVFMRCLWFFLQAAISSLISVIHLIFVKVKYSVLFEVRYGFLTVIQTSFGFERPMSTRR